MFKHFHNISSLIECKKKNKNKSKNKYVFVTKNICCIMFY